MEGGAAVSRILFINACVRENSRTLTLARHILSSMEGEITEVFLEESDIAPLRRETLALRDSLLQKGELDHPMLRYAGAFAEADELVVAAPFWDLGIPALLKCYFEQVTVSGITFSYREGRPVGHCRARRLTYITTAGGPILEDYGYTYIRSLARNFYGIPETVCYRAAMLDVLCISPEELLAKAEITVVE